MTTDTVEVISNQFGSIKMRPAFLTASSSMCSFKGKPPPPNPIYDYSHPVTNYPKTHLKFHLKRATWVKIFTIPWLKSSSSIGLAETRKFFLFHPLRCLEDLRFYTFPTAAKGSLKHLKTEGALPRGLGFHPKVSLAGFRDGIPMAHCNGCLQSWSDATMVSGGVKQNQRALLKTWKTFLILLYFYNTF